MNRTWIVLTTLAFSLATGCGKDDGDSATTGTTGTTEVPGDGDAAAGEGVYSISCAACHGASGEGGTGPAMTTAAAGLSASEVANIALNGSGGMPGVLSDTGDAADVGAYVIATWGS